MQKILIGFFALFAFSCRHTSESAKPPVFLPKELTPVNAKYPSFSAIPIEYRCEGLEDFFQALRGDDGLAINIESSQCKRIPSYDQDENSKFVYNLYLKIKSDGQLFSLIVGNTLEEWEVQFIDGMMNRSPSSTAVTSSRQQLAVDIEKAFLEWKLKDKERTEIIFGKNYLDFANEAISDYLDVDKTPYILDSKTKVLLLPSSDSNLTGTARFIEIDPSVFSRSMSGYLNCKDSGCIENSQILYSFAEDALILSRKYSSGESGSKGIISSLIYFSPK